MTRVGAGHQGEVVVMVFQVRLLPGGRWLCREVNARVEGTGNTEDEALCECAARAMRAERFEGFDDNGNNNGGAQ